MTAEQNKMLVRRLVEEAVNPRSPDVLDEIAQDRFAVAARRWVRPFRDSFPDFTMQIADLAADSEKMAAHFRCSGTHLGEWMGHPPTGRRFHDVDEIYIFHVSGGKLAATFGSRTTWNGCAARPRHVSAARGRTRDSHPGPGSALPGLLVPPRRTAVRVHHRVAIRHRRAATAGAP
jgi:predicted ester cyclase